MFMHFYFGMKISLGRIMSRCLIREFLQFWAQSAWSIFSAVELEQ